MADVLGKKISELEETTDLAGLYTIGSDRNNQSKKVPLQFVKEAADYANAQGDYAKGVGDTIQGNTGVNEYPAFSSSTQYAAGSVVRYNNKLYRFTALHPAGAWVGTDAIETSIKAETDVKLTELESIICNSCVDAHGKLVSLSEIETGTGVYIKIDGSVLTGAPVGTTPFIPVLGLNKIYYTGKNSAPNIVASAAFYDKDYKLLSIVEGQTSDQVRNFPINIPDEAYYVRCCSYKTSEFNIKANAGAFANMVKMLETSTSETNNLIKAIERYAKLSTYYGDCGKQGKAVNFKGEEMTATKEWSCSDFILITDIADFATKGITLVKPKSMYVNDSLYYAYVNFYDAEYNVIGFIGVQETQVNDGKVTISEIPSGAVYIRMNGQGGQISYVEQYSLTSRIEKLHESGGQSSTILCDCVESYGGKIVPLSEIEVSTGAYLNPQGVLLTGAAVGTTPFIPVLGLSRVYYTGASTAPAYVALGCFYDENYNLLSVIPSEFTTPVKNFEVEVPNGAYYARFSTYKTSEFNIKADVGAFANILKIMQTKDQEPINKGGLEDYFSIAMFQKFAIIGDSFASGEISAPNEYGDFYDLSWGQIIARRNGNTCINMSVGGLTTKTWLESTKGLTLLQSSEAQQLYILALGLNDANKTTLGSPEDMTGDSYPDTFYGNYAKIIDAVKAKAPKAKLVMVTTFYNEGNFINVNNAIQNIAEHYGLPCIITRHDAMMASQYYRQHLVSNHPTAPLYSAMAVGYERLLSKCMYENLAYFQDYIG